MTSGNLGPLVTSSKQIAQAVANAKMGLVEDGSTVAGLNAAIQVFLYHCIKDGGGFNKDEIYYPAYDSSMLRSSWETIFWDHDHTGSGDKRGGSLYDIFKANIQSFWHKYNGAVPSEWRFTGPGSLTLDFDTTDNFLNFSTLATAASTASAQIGGCAISFTDLIDLQLRMEALQNTDIFARIGVNVDREDESQSDTRRQMGIECCPASGTSWVVISANGTAGNLLQVATTLDISAARKVYQLTLNSGVDIRFYYDGVLKGTTNSANTPFDNIIDRKRQIVAGVKTNVNNIRELDICWYNIFANPSDQKAIIG